MSEPIFDPNYWAERTRQTYPSEHHKIEQMPIRDWQRAEAIHRLILPEFIKPTDSIVDVGCGYGRLLSLIPSPFTRVGAYTGLDFSQELLQEARSRWGNWVNDPQRRFIQHDIREPLPKPTTDNNYLANKYDIAVLMSIKNMIIHHVGLSAFIEVLENVRQSAHKILVLTPSDPTHVEIYYGSDVC